LGARGLGLQDVGGKVAPHNLFYRTDSLGITLGYLRHKLQRYLKCGIGVDGDFLDEPNGMRPRSIDRLVREQ
jgi:hypothetical protein